MKCKERGIILGDLPAQPHHGTHTCDRDKEDWGVTKTQECVRKKGPFQPDLILTGKNAERKDYKTRKPEWGKKVEKC